jgi:hypothetical protein
VRRRSWPLVGILFLCLSSLLGCSTNRKLETTLVEDKWNESIRRLGMTAVYPPRQINVGDVFLVSYGPTLSPTTELDPVPVLNFDTRLMSIDVRNQLKRDWNKHLNLPAASGSSSNVFDAPSSYSHLPVAAFPGLNVVHITQGELGASFPIANIVKGMLSGAFSDQTALSISIPSALAVELPYQDAAAAFHKLCADRSTKDMCWGHSPFINEAVGTLNTYTDGDELVLVMVTTVYYAQSIDYSYSNDSASVFSGAVSPLAALPTSVKSSSAEAATESTGTTVNVNVSGGNPTATASSTSSALPGCSAAPQDTGSPKSKNAQDTGTKKTTTDSVGAEPTQVKGTTNCIASTQASKPPSTPPQTAESTASTNLSALEEKLNTINKQLSGMAYGGTLTVASADSQGTVLRQSFSYPVAIGYRSIQQELRKGQ